MLRSSCRRMTSWLCVNVFIMCVFAWKSEDSFGFAFWLSCNLTNSPGWPFCCSVLQMQTSEEREREKGTERAECVWVCGVCVLTYIHILYPYTLWYLIYIQLCLALSKFISPDVTQEQTLAWKKAKHGCVLPVKSYIIWPWTQPHYGDHFTWAPASISHFNLMASYLVLHLKARHSAPKV